MMTKRTIRGTKWVHSLSAVHPHKEMIDLMHFLLFDNCYMYTTIENARSKVCLVLGCIEKLREIAGGPLVTYV